MYILWQTDTPLYASKADIKIQKLIVHLKFFAL
jgi:hypothetical protein